MRLLTKDRSFYNSLISLAVPVSLQGLITFSVTMADNLMVSRLGDLAVSGVYMGSQLQTFLQLFSGLLIQWPSNPPASNLSLFSHVLHFAAKGIPA